MPFVSGKTLCGGKLPCCFFVLPALDKPFCSVPPLHYSPPQRLQPFLQASLGPLPVSPPACAKLGFIACHGYREGFPTNLVAEDLQRAPSVELRCHNQYPAARF